MAINRSTETQYKLNTVAAVVEIHTMWLTFNKTVAFRGGKRTLIATIYIGSTTIYVL